MVIKEAKNLIYEVEEEILEDLLKNFTGKKISKFSTTTKKLDQQGNISNVHFFEKTWITGEDKPKVYTDNFGAKRTKLIFLVSVAIAIVAYYFYQK